MEPQPIEQPSTSREGQAEEDYEADEEMEAQDIVFEKDEDLVSSCYTYEWFFFL